LGTDGAEKVVKLSISLFEKKEAEENEVLIDTTVHEKNITYPIDARLHKKIIEGCWRIAEKEGINVTVQNY
jgi:IS5 family transposase